MQIKLPGMNLTHYLIDVVYKPTTWSAPIYRLDESRKIQRRHVAL